MRGRGVLAYVIVVDVLALALSALLLDRHVPDPWTGTFLLATLVALAGATPVRLSSLKTTVSATDPFVFTALAAYGPMPACIVAFVGVLGSVIGRDTPRNVLHLAFNSGNVVLSTAAGALAYLAVGGVPGAPVGSQIGPLLPFTVVYFVLNTGLVSGAIRLDTGRPLLENWRGTNLWTGVSAFVGLTLAVGLLALLDLVGPSGLALGIPPVWLLVAFYRTHKERQEEQQRRIQQIEVLNHELEDKVVERTAELQQALHQLERANASLLTANERLREANRAKSEFLANVSHELRTPLNAIIGFSDLLSDGNFGQLNKQQRDFVRDIHESGDHLLRLINDILDLSKIEAGKMEIHLERVEIGRAVRDAASMLRPQAAKKSLRLALDVPPGDVVAMIDPGFFRQVLVNLLSNAVKFTSSGGEVRVGFRREDRTLVCWVRDTGIGIAPEDVGRIFEEFFQVDGSYSRNYGGTGLGLALVRRMLDMLGGRIEVASTQGEGTCFTIRIADCVLDEAPAAEPEPAAPDPARPRALEPGARRVVVVVEDNAVNRKLARNVLRSRGYTVLEAVTGEEALDLVRRSRVDLVLMDIQLPGMDGLEVTRRLKADPATASIPVVALTAHAQPADEVRAREAGCAGYITKPIRLSAFPGQVESFLAEAEAARPGS